MTVLNNVASLAALDIPEEHNFVPAFSSAVTSYKLNVPAATASVTFTPTLSSPSDSTMTLNTAAATSGVAAPPMTINTSSLGTAATIVVTAADGLTKQTYTLTILREPTISVVSANGITNNAANLRGMVLTNGPTNTVSFEYGLTAAYGNTAEATPDSVSGTTSTLVSLPLTGLLPGQTYHYRVISDNTAFQFVSEDGTVTTLENSEVWRIGFFGNKFNSGAGADLNDPAKDSVVNLIKFATGLNPLTAATMPGSARIVGETLEFTYTRNKSAVGEVGFAVKWSNTLEADSWSSEGVTETAVVDQGATELVTVSVPKGNGGFRFVRLEIVP